MPFSAPVVVGWSVGETSHPGSSPGKQPLKFSPLSKPFPRFGSQLHSKVFYENRHNGKVVLKTPRRHPG